MRELKRQRDLAQAELELERKACKEQKVIYIVESEVPSKGGTLT